MSGRPRVVLLTGNGLRHRYAASRLASSLDVVGILVEAKPKAIKEPETLPSEEVEVMDQHLATRDAVERRLLGEASFPAGAERMEVPTGGSNAPEVFEWVEGMRPDAVVLYGTSIIRPPLLDRYDGRMINMHLGLSPYYRGAGTNFWPLVDNRPECVGATIHLAVLKVDAGAMLTQVRPEVEAGDHAHEIGTKTIVAGLEAMQRAIPEYLAGRLAPVAQDLTRGSVYRRADFNAAAVRRLWENLDAGMVPSYLERREERLARYPIVERV